jgi:hypothetical protein
VIVHLVDSLYDGDLFDAVKAAVGQLHGAYAIAVFCKDEPQPLVGARAGSPLILGVGRTAGELPGQRRDGAGRRDRPDRLPGRGRRGRRAAGQILDGRQGAQAGQRAGQDRAGHSGAAELGPYRHYMQKEIFEQPRAIADTLEGVQGIVPELFDGRRRATGCSRRSTGADPGLRHQLLQRLHRQVLAGEHRRHPDPGRGGQRIPLPRLGAQPAHAGGHHHPERRDRRHPGRAAPRAERWA